MTDIENDDGLRSLWRRDDAPLTPLPLAEIKARAAAFRRTIGKRIWLLNRRAAAMLRKQIDRLEAATHPTEGETK